jgi:hypothetical protein
MNMASDETSRVLMVYFMLGMLRMGGVIAERMELQDKGVLEVDCPVCLGQLTSGNGFVPFHLLECGHRCEAARTCAACEAARTCAVRPPTCVRQSRRQSRPPYPRARSHCVCRRVHEECLLQIEETPDAAGGVVRTCPLCRGASRVTRTFVMKGAMA